MPNKKGTSGSFTMNRKIGSAKSHEVPTIHNFVRGYRNREDVTLLPPETLVTGSFNVLSNVSGRIGIRKGYTLDGAESAVAAPILSAYDWPTHFGVTRHLRAGFLTSAGNDGKLQFRYVSDDGTVTWTDLLTGLDSSSFNFADYWDNTNLQSLLLMVNGGSKIYDWSGLVTTIASTTVNTITKNGTESWAEVGAYVAGTRSVTINGTVYTYTGGESTTTLTGVTPNPTGEAADSVAFQTVRTTLNSAMTGIPATLNNDLIGSLRNQIYIGAFNSNNVYVSKVNDYTNYSYSTPRVVGEGALLTLDGTPVSFNAQEEQMYIGAGKDQIYLTKFTLSSDLSNESFEVNRLKTTSLQAPLSQKATTKIKNNIVYMSNEPILNSLGRVDNVVLTPQITDISYPIVNDLNSYDLTDCSVFYHRQFCYVAVPNQSLFLVYNQTNPSNQYWEAPQVIPISCFSNIDGELYGHSYLTSESYKMFNGYADRANSDTSGGNTYSASAMFAYQNMGTRSDTKSCNKFFIEGYINQSTTLTAGLRFNLDGCATSITKDIDGTDTAIVCIGGDDNSLGKNPLGVYPLGGLSSFTSSGSLPPHFMVFKTFQRVPFSNMQPSFTSTGINQQWELLSFGTNSTPTTEGQNDITQ